MKKIVYLLLLSTFVVSCNTNSMQGLLIQTDSITLVHGETSAIKASSDYGLLCYKSSNSAIAAVDEKGNVTANVVGTAEISVQDGKETKVCRVTVKPRYGAIPLKPYIQFGASMTDVKNAVKDVFIEELTTSNNRAEKVLVYYNQMEEEKSRISYEYHFLNDQLTSTGVYVNEGVDFFDHLIPVLDETYYFDGEYPSTATNSSYSYQRNYWTIDQKIDLKVFSLTSVTEFYLLFSPMH